MKPSTSVGPGQATLLAIGHLETVMHKPPAPKGLAHCGEPCVALRTHLCDACDNPNPRECREVEQCLARIEPEDVYQYPCVECKEKPLRKSEPACAPCVLNLEGVCASRGKCAEKSGGSDG